MMVCQKTFCLQETKSSQAKKKKAFKRHKIWGIRDAQRALREQHQRKVREHEAKHLSGEVAEPWGWRSGATMRARKERLIQGEPWEMVDWGGEHKEFDYHKEKREEKNSGRGRWRASFKIMSSSMQVELDRILCSNYSNLGGEGVEIVLA